MRRQFTRDGRPIHPPTRHPEQSCGYGGHYLTGSSFLRDWCGRCGMIAGCKADRDEERRFDEDYWRRATGSSR